MAKKIACPSCGAENYDTDQVCMSCGASLTEPAPQRPQHEAIEEGPGETPRPEPKPEAVVEAPAAQTSLKAALVKAILVSTAIGLIEMLIVAFTAGQTAGIIPLKGMVYLLIGGLLYGALRGLMLGFLAKETKWSPGITLLLGLGLAFSFGAWPNYLFGAIAGFSIGMIIESALPPPQAYRTGRPSLPRRP